MHHLQYIFPGGRYPCHMPRPVWLVCTEVPNEVNLVVSPTTQRSLLVYRLPTFFFLSLSFSLSFPKFSDPQQTVGLLTCVAFLVADPSTSKRLQLPGLHLTCM